MFQAKRVILAPTMSLVEKKDDHSQSAVYYDSSLKELPYITHFMDST